MLVIQEQIRYKYLTLFPHIKEEEPKVIGGGSEI